MPISPEAKAAYDREYRAKNKARIAENKRAYATANPERVAATSRAWTEANRVRSREIKQAWKERNPYVAHPRELIPEPVLKAAAVERVAKWRKANPAQYAAQIAKAVYKPRTPEQKAHHTAQQTLRNRRLQCAQPQWVDRKAIDAIYLEGQRTGMHVDHIIPLKGRLVSGLHVENNLQLLTPAANLSKRNKFSQEANHAS